MASGIAAVHLAYTPCCPAPSSAAPDLLAALSSLARALRSLQENEHLEELHLLGNPCTRWPGYRPYVIGTLPRLRRLDGEPVGTVPHSSLMRQLVACGAG